MRARLALVATFALAPMSALAESRNVTDAAARGLAVGIILALAALLIAFIKKRIVDAAGVEPSKSELARASANGQLEKVIALVEAGVDVNHQDDRGGTALMLAARNNQLPVVEYLLRHGAQVDLKTKSGVSALDVALKHGNSRVTDAIALAGLK